MAICFPNALKSSRNVRASVSTCGGGSTRGTSYEKLFCVANVVRRSAPAAIAAASRGLMGGRAPRPGETAAWSRGERRLASRCSGDGRRSVTGTCEAGGGGGGGERRQLGSSAATTAADRRGDRRLIDSWLSASSGYCC